MSNTEGVRNIHEELSPEEAKEAFNAAVDELQIIVGKEYIGNADTDRIKDLANMMEKLRSLME